MAGVVIRTGSLANLDHFDSISVASGSFNGAVTVERSQSPSSLLRATYRRKSTSIFNLTSQKGKSYESLQNLLREMDARREHACCLRAITTCETLQLSIADDCMLFTTDTWRSIVRSAQNLDQKQCEQQEAVWELLVTELYFIQRLNVLRKFYRDTITELQKRDATLFPNLDCGKLFDNLDDIFEAHVMFWNKCCSSVILQARSTGLPLNPLLMYDGILKVNKFLECYSSYCAHYQSMTAYLKSQVQQDENLQLLMSWFEEQPECERQPLSHWLMKPVQRLTKYPILMQAILKKTSDDQHRLLLRHMMDVLEDFVHTINRRVKESQEEEALIKVHHRLVQYTLYDGLTDEISSILAAFCGRQDLLRSVKGTFVKEFTVKFKKVDDQLRRVDAVLLLFSQTVLICKRLKKQGDRLKVIKPPLPLSKLQLYRLREAPSFLMVLLNSHHLVVEAHVLYASSIAQLDTILAALLRTQEALARASTTSSREVAPCSRHFNFMSYEQRRQSTDSPNDTETEVDSGSSPYSALYTPSPPTSPMAAPLARSNAMTSMQRSQLLAGRRCRTVSDCPLQHSMSFPPTCSVATHSPLRHSTSHLQDGPSAATLARSSSDQQSPTTPATLTRQRSASFSQVHLPTKVLSQRIAQLVSSRQLLHCRPVFPALYATPAPSLTVGVQIAMKGDP
ncbi:hypothetical protein RvY_03393-3 [Ramazzottius varieornatus]|uniref:DH domain-containing protein n=1 Tax=Ramazzottius varieornatus TaxID=947166 RepID=A0A1D1UMW1_RAMVA|nr:hypothetical protein RvY_03393-3 [Ramazzottius varieornatus]